jgi:RNA polymerase sigma factor (sigma-70 family)
MTIFTALPVFCVTTAAGLTRWLAPGKVAQSPPATPCKPSPSPVTDTEQNISDGTLLQAIAGGEEWALEALYERYARYAYALAYRIVHEGSAAEDVVQDVFLAIWRKAGSYHEQQGSVRSWLQAIVHHRAIDYIRASAHRDQQWTTFNNEQDQKDAQTGIWEEVWHLERRSLIRQLLTQLPAEQRLVIELAYFGGYTHVEIAERWNIPLGTVKGRMRLGLHKMKTLLAQNGLETF